jgi:ABC-type transport system involved in multi-copper enzyme maturation permease subunit
MKNAIRAEFLKMRSMPGIWITFWLVFPFTVFGLLIAFATAGGFTGHTFFFVHTLNEKRELLGSGYTIGIPFLAPILGVICVTSEYRHKTITTTVLLTPRRSRVLIAKIVTVVLWTFCMAAVSLVVVAAVGLPWNAGLGGTTSSVVDQMGAVVPGLLAATVLMGLFGLGFGTLVKNQVAGILLTIGGTFILEQLLVLLAKQIFHYDLNWLPSAAAASLAGDIARGAGDHDEGIRLLSWWAGGLVMLGWGLIPLTIGYFTTFRRDVT